jgi:hypothetical protein
MGKFSQSIRASSQNLLVAVNNKVYSIAWELFTTVVKLTPSKANPGPHAKGLLANQWYPQEGSASTARSNAMSDNGAGSLARIQAMLGGTEFLGKDGKLTLTNNIDYAILAETEGWQPPKWRGTKPYMMVAKSLQIIAAKHKKVKL